jgi:hypothetical protein
MSLVSSSKEKKLTVRIRAGRLGQTDKRFSPEGRRKSRESFETGQRYRDGLHRYHLSFYRNYIVNLQAIDP